MSYRTSAASQQVFETLQGHSQPQIRLWILHQISRGGQPHQRYSKQIFSLTVSHANGNTLLKFPTGLLLWDSCQATFATALVMGLLLWDSHGTLAWDFCFGYADHIYNVYGECKDLLYLKNLTTPRVSTELGWIWQPNFWDHCIIWSAFWRYHGCTVPSVPAQKISFLGKLKSHGKTLLDTVS